MINLRRKRMRERRAEILNRLRGRANCAVPPRTSGHRHAPGDGQRDRGLAPLCRALADLGPVFASYGVYLSARGDLLPQAYRHELAALGREVVPMPAAHVQAIVRAETGRAKKRDGSSKSQSDAIAALEHAPFDTRLLFQRHHGRLKSGRAVVVRVARSQRDAEFDVKLLALLRDIVSPFFADGRLFLQSIDDFRATLAATTDGFALAEALDFLRRDAQELDCLSIPTVYRELSTSRVLVLEHIAGKRLSAAATLDNAHAADDTGGADGSARLLCEIWLRHAFDGGLIAMDLRAENALALGRSRLAIDEGTFAILPSETRQALLKYLIAVALDEPRKALDSLQKEFDGTHQRVLLNDLDRLFRQMVPDDAGDGSFDDLGGRLAAIVSAQWRLAIENGYWPLRHGLPVLRGIVELDETVRRLAPHRDAVLEGLKDFRVTRLLGDVQRMLEPVHWIGRFDNIASLVLSSPRLLDDALSATGSTRSSHECAATPMNVSPTRLRRAHFPVLGLLLVLGLFQGRASPIGEAGGPWGEAIAALLFVVLGYWLLNADA